MWNLTKLLLAIAPLLTSHAYAPSDAIELDIDVDNIFSSAEEMRWKRSVVGTTAPGTCNCYRINNGMYTPTCLLTSKTTSIFFQLAHSVLCYEDEASQ